ncbi:MAG: hypothetical protein JNJ54_34500 [Myxococcaceae bacterium]|nr:hypothetical protein [Myxococcaceae bacterium]
MSSAPWLVRLARATRRDRLLLAGFVCADPLVPWQVEVESFVREQLFDWRFDPHARGQDPRLLLVFERRSRTLVGVAAHERITLVARTTFIPATQLEVIAVAHVWQGRRFKSGVRASDVVMSAVLSDVRARVPPRDARVLAVVHEENVRSIELCRRHGFVEELSRPVDLPQYRRLITRHVGTRRGR